MKNKIIIASVAVFGVAIFALARVNASGALKITDQPTPAATPTVLKFDETQINNLNALSDSQSSSDTAIMKDGFQEIAINLSSYSYPAITVQKDVPVRYVITASAGSLNACNNEIVIPAYGISKKLELGENIIEFTPTETGIVPYSCWMGMLNSTIAVVDDLNQIDSAAIQGQIDAMPARGGCCSGR